MSRLRLTRLESIDAVRQAAAGWDRLWLSAEVSTPTVRAEMVAAWIERFAPRSRTLALVVEEAGEPVAALPLAARRIGNMLTAGDLTSNYWASNGDLLVRADADVDSALDLLADGLDELPWPLVWLDLVPAETARWRKLVNALARRGLAVDAHQRYEIGLTDIAGSYDEYFAGRSRNHRQGLRKNRRRLEREGPVELRVLSEFSASDIEPSLRRAFEIEHKSWKGEAGTTVLGTPGAFDFYLGQARQLAAWGCLRLVFLEHRGEPIAFEFGWTAKGVYHCYKVGYDPAAAQFSPGQLLRMLLIERFFETGDCRQIDFQGPLTDAVARWSTGSYGVSRLVIAPRRTTSRVLLAAYRAAAATKRRFLGR